MADAPPPQQHVLMVGDADTSSTATVTLQEDTPAIEDPESDGQPKQEVVEVSEVSRGADILQQALQEATEFEPSTVEYDDVENAVAEVHGEHEQAEQEQAEQEQADQEQAEQEQAEQEQVEQEQGVEEVTELSTAVVVEEEEDEAAKQPAEEEVVEEEAVKVADEKAEAEAEDSDVSVIPNPAMKSSGIQSIRLLAAVGNSKSTKPNAQAPIGSSQNPIQIIQQGSTYHSTQVLSQEQLQQIAQVLQQQQQLSQLNPNGGTSVLYNAATNTRIVYRIIYPTDVQNKSNASKVLALQKPVQTPTVQKTSTPTPTGTGRGRGRPRKPWGKGQEEPEESRAESPGLDMSREEKEEKKKHRPRTRSGRISKPPKYMMKDYKRIHHLDFDEEPYDDSDGGYSDYRVSADEDDDNSRSSTSSLTETGMKKRNRCQTCNKMYIGKGGLARHYRLNPKHGNCDDLGVDFNGTSPETPMSVGESQASNDGPITIKSITKVSPAFQSDSATPMPPRRRGRPANHEMAAVRRKAKLKEALKGCDAEELSEIVLPTLTKAVSVWEYLLKKCEGEPDKPNIASVCKELDVLLKQAQKMAEEFLSFMPNSQIQKGGGEYLQIHDPRLAEALGITMGLYEIKKESSSYFKVFSKEQKDLIQNQSNFRTIKIVAPDSSAAHPNKRLRIEETTPGNSAAETETVVLSRPVGQYIQSQPMVLDFAGVTKTLKEDKIDELAAPEVVPNAAEAEIEDLHMEVDSVEAPEAAQDEGEMLVETSLDQTESEVCDTQTEVEETLQIAEPAAENSVSNPDSTTYVSTDGVLQIAASDIESAENTVQLESAENTVQLESSENTVQLESSENTLQLESAENMLQLESTENTVLQVASEGESSETVQITQSQLVDQMQIVCTENDESTIEGENVIRLTENGMHQFITPEGHVLMQDADGQPILGQVICQSNEDGEIIRQVVIQDGQILTGSQLEGVAELGELSTQAVFPSNVVILQNPDGTHTALQLPEGENALPLETVQALFAMDPETRARILNTQTEESTE